MPVEPQFAQLAVAQITPAVYGKEAPPPTTEDRSMNADVGLTSVGLDSILW